MEQGQLNWIANFIWGIADDVLRDLYVRGKYRDVILPMTVLRGLDAVLEPSKQAVLDMKASLDRARIVHQDQALREAAGHVLQHLEVHAARPQPRGRAGALDARQFALSVALGGIAPPVVAGAATVFCRLMPSFARPFLANSRPGCTGSRRPGTTSPQHRCPPVCSGELRQGAWPRATPSMRRCWSRTSSTRRPSWWSPASCSRGARFG